jgi:hypothetical protein
MAADIDTDSSTLFARLYRETISRIDWYEARVTEGQDLMAALDFARYVLWSGIVPICKEHACDSGAPLKVDGSFLQYRAEDLQRNVQDRFARDNGKIKIRETQLEALNRKLDLIAGYVSRLK